MYKCFGNQQKKKGTIPTFNDQDTQGCSTQWAFSAINVAAVPSLQNQNEEFMPVEIEL